MKIVRGFARNLPMTSRQNQPTMTPIFEPGACRVLPVATYPRGTPHEITETHRPGTGRVIGAVDRSTCAGHHRRRGRPDDGRRIRVRPSVEERRRTGGQGHQCRRRLLGKKLALEVERRCLRSQAGAFGGGKDRQRENPVRRRPLLFVVVDPGVGSLCRRQCPADHAGLDQSAVHRAQAVERRARLRPRRSAGPGRRRIHREKLQGQERRHPQRQDHLRQGSRRRNQEGAQQGRLYRKDVRILQQGRQGLHRDRLAHEARQHRPRLSSADTIRKRD